QAGYAGTPLIELNGANAGTTANGLYILASNCTVRGLAINRFGLGGIRLETAGSNIVAGNFIGTGPQGTNSLPNGDVGVFLDHAAGNRIGGTNAGDRNVISGNLHAGVFIFECDSSGNTIQGNLIGTSLSGLVPLGNRTNGIVIDNAP